MDIGDTVISAAAIGYFQRQPFGLIGEIISKDEDLYLIKFDNWEDGHDGNYWRKVDEMPRHDLWFCVKRDILTVDEFYELVEKIDNLLAIR